MNFGDLEYFAAVVQSESITRAAEQLGITQPSLSKAMSRVEEDVGACLFTRTGNKIHLNQYGMLYYRAALDGLGLIKNAMDEIRDSRASAGGSIHIATTFSGFLDPVIAAYHFNHPEDQLCQYLLPHAELADALRSGNIDLAFSSAPIYQRGIRWTPLLTDEMLLFVSPDHPLYGTASADLNQFAQDQFVVNNSGLISNDDVYQLCRRAGFEPKVIYAGGEAEIVIYLIGQRAVSFITESTIERQSTHPPENLPLAGDNPNLSRCYIHITHPICTRTYGVAMAEGRYQTVSVRRFMNLANQHFSQLAQRRTQRVEA